MADRVKRVRLEVTYDGKSWKAYERDAKQAQQATEDFAKSGDTTLKKWNQNLGEFATKAGIALVALGGAFKVADEFSQIGQTALRNRAALEALTDTTEDYTQKVKAVQAATRGLTTESEAAAIAARLQQFGLADTAGEMQNFVDTIVRVGAVNPMLGDTTEAITQIQLTLSNMSFMRLDQLGLSSGAVRKRMAELRQETRGLSEDAAFQQAVMEGLAQQASRVSDSVLEIGGAQGRFKTMMREVGDSIGIYITGRLDEAANSILMIRDILQEISVGEFAVKLAIEVADQTGIIDRAPGAQATGFQQQLAGQGITLPENIQQNLPYIFATERDPIGFLIQGGFIPQDYLEQIGQRATEQIGSMFGWGFGSAPVPLTTTMNIGAARARQNQTASASDLFQMGLSSGVDSATLASMISAAGTNGTFDPTMIGAGGLVVTPGTLAGRNREQSAAMGNIRRANAPTTGAGFELMQAGGAAMSWAQDQTAATVATIADNVGSLADKLFNAADAAGQFVEQSQKFQSINEMLGVAPEALDADIYNRAAEALRNANVEGDAYAEAIRILGIDTGVTNVSNEVFNQRIDNLAKALADGTITASDYVEQIRLLQTQDWSKIQGFADSMDPQKAAEFAAALGAPGGQEAFDTAYGKMQDIMNLIRGGSEGEGEESDLGPFGQTATQADALAEYVGEANKRMTDDAVATWGTVSSTGTQAFSDIETRSVEAFDTMRKNLAAMNFNIEVKTSLMMGSGPTRAGAPGGPEIPEFAEGGFTGPGNSPFPAILHQGEFVLSADMLNSLKSNAGLTSQRRASMIPSSQNAGRLSAEAPIVLMIGENELARVQANIALKTNTAGSVASYG